MYGYHPVGEIFLQASTNGICQLTRHFPTENEWFIWWIRIHPCVHIRHFGLKKGDWTDHVQKLELTLNKMKERGPRCNIEKSFFGKTEMEYLGSWVTHDGVKRINRKIESITNMKPTTPQKYVRKFIGVTNYYRNIWPRRSHTLAP